MSSTVALNYNVTAKKMDSYFLPVFISVGIIYALIYFGLIVGYDTHGPDREIMRKTNVKRAAEIIVKKVEQQIEQKIKPLPLKPAITTTNVPKIEQVTEDAGKKDIATAVKDQVSTATKKIVGTSEAKKLKIAETRAIERNRVKAEREQQALVKGQARLAVIQAKSTRAGGGSAESYKQFTASSSGNISAKLAAGGGISVSGGGSGKAGGGSGRSSNVASFGGGKGTLDDVFGGRNYGDISDVAGIEEFKVTPLAVKSKGTQNSSRKTEDLQKELNARLKTLQQCIKKGRSRSNELTGAVVVQFAIKADGKVNRVRIVKASWNDNGSGKIVENCICDGIAEWRFSPVEKGEISIEQPFIF